MENNEREGLSGKEGISGFNNRINLLSSKELDGFIKNLSRPNFLGSIHLQNPIERSNNFVNTLVNKDLQLRLNKSLKNSFFNPVTKFLILLMILFNLLWFSLILFF